MTTILEILEYNKDFVQNKKYSKYKTTKYPDKKIVILTCMDTRLLELLPQAMDLKNGDAKIIKNAGAVVSHPFGSIMRSIIVAIYELNAEEVYVIGHYDCGMSNINYPNLIEKFKLRGITEEKINTLINSGIDLPKWLAGFDTVEQNVVNSVNIIKNHPLLPKNVDVHGLVMNPETGELKRV